MKMYVLHFAQKKYGLTILGITPSHLLLLLHMIHRPAAAVSSEGLLKTQNLRPSSQT